MSLERDGELRAQLNLQAASLSSRIWVCGLYMFVCMLTIVCADGSLSVHWHPLWQSLSLESKWTKWANKP